MNEIPLKDLRHGQLVRFRGMVQDQLGPEMYGSGALLKNTASGVQRNVSGKFKDELKIGVSKLKCCQADMSANYYLKIYCFLFVL